jgi:hypothetical protein
MMKSVSWLSAWALLFIAIAMIVSLILLVGVFIPLGYSMGTLATGEQAGSMSRAFMVNLLASGIISDLILRYGFKAKVMAIKEPPLPFVWLWSAVFVMMLFVGFPAVSNFVKSIAGVD